jgi:hypothetical protein
MTGPRTFARGAKPYERPCDSSDVIGQKSHFIIEQWWATNVHRRGHPVETILCDTPGQVNQHRQKLSAEGLIGHCRSAS